MTHLLKPNNDPCTYFPLSKGVYEVLPGLQPLSTDFGNGQADQKIFQFDCEFHRYRKNIVACHEEGIDKYFHTSGFPLDLEQTVSEFIVTRLLDEYPDYFKIVRDSMKTKTLDCLLTGEHLVFDRDWRFLRVLSYPLIDSPDYQSGLDALSSQIAEDLSIWTLESSGREWLSAIHLCAPNHWSPGNKIGQDFKAVHEPVAENEKIMRPAKSLVDAMVHKGPFVRFAWGIATDKRLNHHPQCPNNFDHRKQWQGRAFNPKKPELYIRFERQTLTGFSQQGISLFTIRTYFIDCEEIRKEPTKNPLLQSAIKSMPPSSLKYKGLDRDADSILAWLQDG